ncbi:MAG TPA: hypothetical protein VF884_14645 [Nitrososphaeraceae archaeon]
MLFDVMSVGEAEPLEWSSWVDYGRSNINAVPESPGVFKMHAHMKILYIGSSLCLRQSLLDSLSHPCLNQASRFSYAIIDSADKVQEQLLNEYRATHNGKSPSCM